MAPNAVRLIRRLGALPILERAAVPLQVGWEFRRWDDGRVLFAHGQGAAQAIEDAAVLALCLGGEGTDVRAALRAYQDARIERATSVQLSSNDRKDSNHLHDGPEQRARDANLASADPLHQNEWLYGFDAEKAVIGHTP
ncbi:hypothetical protein ACQPWY_27190 [Pseudonocardia xinjiangensis]|uniref:hypothetical protein n=1 Tax=Pseudonocardia xinjiangensis TaxID=75289 RepID=UPI003D89D303